MKDMKLTIAVILFSFLITMFNPNYSPSDETSMTDYTELNTKEIIDNTTGLYKPQFYQNKGQIKIRSVEFYGKIPGGFIGFATSEIYLWMDNSNDGVILSFYGAESVVPVSFKPSSYLTHYFLGERGTFTNVQGYDEIKYESLWPGIDLVYKATSRGAKYEFVIKPGANPQDIKIQSIGHDLLEVQENSFTVKKSQEAFIDDGLFVYQGDKIVQANYLLEKSSIISYHIAEYDRDEILVIDPLLFSSYYGGIMEDQAKSVAIDNQGNIYVTGHTISSNFPISINAYSSSMRGDIDCFVLKLNPEGNEILYSTYIGGSRASYPTYGLYSGTDFGESIAVDSEGNAFVAGNTLTNDFPTTEGAFDIDENYGNYTQYLGDGFLFKLNATGNGLIYSSYLGGAGGDHAYSVAVDSSGSAIVGGYTYSEDFPIANAFRPTKPTGIEGFVTKFSPDGESIIYSSFVGGGGLDEVYAVAVDENDHAYITGFADSRISLAGIILDSTYHGEHDSFVYELDSDGEIVFSTLLGGINDDHSRSIVVDHDGNIYVAGRTESPDFPIIEGFNHNFTGSSDAFVCKISSSRNSFEYSTLLGGKESETIFSITVDEDGNIFATGKTTSNDLTLTENAEQLEYPGNDTAFVMKLSENGSTVSYSSYIGGSYNDQGNGIALGSNSNIVVVGTTRSLDFPTNNSMYNSSLGDYDCFILALDVQEAHYYVPIEPDDFGISDLSIPISISIAAIFVVAIIYVRKKLKDIEAEKYLEAGLIDEMEDELDDA